MNEISELVAPCKPTRGLQQAGPSATQSMGITARDLSMVNDGYRHA